MQIQTHPGEIEPLLSPGQMPQHTSKRTGRKWLKVAYLTSKQVKPCDELIALSLPSTTLKSNTTFLMPTRCSARLCKRVRTKNVVEPAGGIDCGYFGNQLWFRSASMPQASVKTVMAAPSQCHVFPFAVVTF